MSNLGELIPILGMATGLLLVLMIGGFVLLYPLAKRLGDVMDEWLRLRKAALPREDALRELHADVAELSLVVGDVGKRLAALSDRQEFVEKMIETREPAVLPTPDQG